MKKDEGSIMKIEKILALIVVVILVIMSIFHLDKTVIGSFVSYAVVVAFSIYIMLLGILKIKVDKRRGIIDLLVGIIVLLLKVKEYI